MTPSKTYPILEKLLNKGLIAQVKKDKTLHFSPNDPEKILTYISEKKNALDNIHDEVEKEIPKLRKLTTELPTDARVLQGLGGLKTFYEEHQRKLLTGKKIFRSFAFEDDWGREDVKRFVHKQDLIRKELGIEVRIIAHEKIRKVTTPEEYKLANIRFTKQNIPVGTVVSEDQIALITWKKEPVIIVIDSKEIGKAYSKFFEDVWKDSK